MESAARSRFAFLSTRSHDATRDAIKRTLLFLGEEGWGGRRSSRLVGAFNNGNARAPFPRVFPRRVIVRPSSVRPPPLPSLPIASRSVACAVHGDLNSAATD
jgi:hypothetical protein